MKATSRTPKLTHEEALALLRVAIGVETLADGSVRMTMVGMAGMFGIGSTSHEAAADLAEKLVNASTRSKTGKK